MHTETVPRLKDPDCERSLLSSLARDPLLAEEMIAFLRSEHFPVEQRAWLLLEQAVKEGRRAPLFRDWGPAVDPWAAAGRLEDLRRRRFLVASLWRAMGRAVSGEAVSPAEILDALAAEAEEAGILADESKPAASALELARLVVEEAGKRAEARRRTGRPVLGIPTGITGLDDVLNGLEPGLHILAGPPGAGKTTLAAQICLRAAEDGAPATYITWENSPESIVKKLLCASAGIPCRDVDRGYADPTCLETAAQALAEALGRLRVVEGTKDLARAFGLRRLIRQPGGGGVLVVDYLQRAAHALGFDQLRHSVAALAAELREVALREGVAVLAISSQNRAAGGYGDGAGTPALDSLKESGDLEYAADSVLCLVPAKERPQAPPARALDLVVVKNRFGDTGKVRLVFRPDVACFREEVAGHLL